MQYHGRVKRFVRRGRTQYSDMGDLTSDKDLVSRDKRNEIRHLRINEEFRGMHRDQHGFLEPIVGP
jgi:hypothetical protein